MQVLGPRSRTVLDLAMLEHAPQLRAVGAYCTGTNNIDLRAAAERGVAVFNRSPHWIRTPSMLGCWAVGACGSPASAMRVHPEPLVRCRGAGVDRPGPAESVRS